MAPLLRTLDEYHAAINGAKPLVVLFQARDCSHCRVLRPTFDQLATQHSDALDFREVDVEASADIASAAGVLSTPTTSVYSGGATAATLKGAIPGHLSGMIEATLEGLREANAGVASA